MGRPKEMTEQKRLDLSALGFRRMEFWVGNRDSEPYRREVERQLDEMRRADAEDEEVDDWVPAVRGTLWDEAE